MKTSFDTTATDENGNRRRSAAAAVPRLSGARLAAEAAYAAAPLAHLAALGAAVCAGKSERDSWAPFAASLSCDLFRYNCSK